MPHSRTASALPSRRILRGIGFAAAATLALAAAVPAQADGATVTSGDVHAFATSSDPAITGRATMVRTADGKTIVTIHAEGLLANTTYGSHVHLQACANGNAGGHYRFDPAGPAAPPNEIHLGFTTNEAGVGLGRAVVDATAGPTAMAVVIHAPGGAKIACADLE
ncbi:MAG: superoxide dismutase family protein [Candidatus Eisenbacteria bacterium]|uniref:Superoxide dismutase family protein n=1 Tax=Eiseniibacteriota bacterium TaxID=2212470 RepID=A0A538TXA7_UNCEI|nr:MAG: superoxide dismutase family protein [Candidatus Eisenbacteria bacterium]